MAVPLIAGLPGLSTLPRSYCSAMLDVHWTLKFPGTDVSAAGILRFKPRMRDRSLTGVGSRGTSGRVLALEGLLPSQGIGLAKQIDGAKDRTFST